MKFQVLFVFVILAISGCVATHHTTEVHHNDGFFSSLTNTFWNLWPFGSRLGHDWEDTQTRMEQIYQHHHNEAKMRVDSLREDVVEQAHLQDKIAEIYQNEMAQAEKEIEKMKRPLLSRLTTWHREPTEHEKRTILERWGLKKVKEAELAPHHLFEDTTRKISDTYKTSLAGVKGKLTEAGSAAEHGWEAAKARAAHAYNEAFHRGHGEARSRFGYLRDILNFGFRGAATGAKNMVLGTWNFFIHGLTNIFSLMLGAVLGVALLHYYGKRKFRKQLNANVAGPVMAVGEYYVVGGEEKQKRFFDFWSGPASTYFHRQPGLRKYWMHRGISGLSNAWLCYSEWASIEDLRRACNTNEFFDLKRRSPIAFQQMTIYQLTSVGGAGETLLQKDITAGGRVEHTNLRQRGTPSIPTAS